MKLKTLLNIAEIPGPESVFSSSIDPNLTLTLTKTTDLDKSKTS